MSISLGFINVLNVESKHCVVMYESEVHSKMMHLSEVGTKLSRIVSAEQFFSNSGSEILNTKINHNSATPTFGGSASLCPARLKEFNEM